MTFDSLIERYNTNAEFRQAVELDPIAALQTIGYSLEEASEAVQGMLQHLPGEAKNC
ncbi:MAG: hypothetical protein AAF646_04190 [Pseudomonadota bacterium]